MEDMGGGGVRVANMLQVTLIRSFVEIQNDSCFLWVVHRHLSFSRKSRQGRGNVTGHRFTLVHTGPHQFAPVHISSHQFTPP